MCVYVTMRTRDNNSMICVDHKQKHTYENAQEHDIKIGIGNRTKWPAIIQRNYSTLNNAAFLLPWLIKNIRFMHDCIRTSSFLASCESIESNQIDYECVRMQNVHLIKRRLHIMRLITNKTYSPVVACEWFETNVRKHKVSVFDWSMNINWSFAKCEIQPKSNCKIASKIEKPKLEMQFIHRK